MMTSARCATAVMMLLTLIGAGSRLPSVAMCQNGIWVFAP